MNQKIVWPWERALAAMTQALRVSSSTQSHTLATAILRYLDEGYIVYLECIGVPSINIAMKAVAIGNGEAGAQGKVLSVLPHFERKSLPNRDGGGGSTDITAMRFMVSRAPVLMWFNDGDSET